MTVDTFRIELPELGLVSQTTVSVPAIRPMAPRAPAPSEIRSGVVLGGPDLARMRSRDDDDRHLADRRGGSDFWSVLMTLSIDPVEPETIRLAWLKVNLAADGGRPPPIAFAMEPAREEAGEQVERGGSAEATIKILKLGGAEKRTYTARHEEVLALNRLRSDPAWELTPSPGRPVRPTDFVLVVKAPRGSAGGGTVSFGAEVVALESLSAP